MSSETRYHPTTAETEDDAVLSWRFDQLCALGFEDVSHVRVGRMVELEAGDESEVAALTEKLLANPLVEDFEIEVL